MEWGGGFENHCDIQKRYNRILKEVDPYKAYDPDITLSCVLKICVDTLNKPHEGFEQILQRGQL